MRKKTWFCLLFLTAAMLRAEPPTADGIYATFAVSRGGTPVGEIRCRLEHEKVPRTVANFVGLAEGSRAWVDFQRAGLSRKPFYDGLVFHRVVVQRDPNTQEILFDIVQSGSPKGDGSDGPGYTFKDEFDSSLRHDAPGGVLSMANSGLNSNGSQFFITRVATPHLDDVHSVFGHTVDQSDLDALALVQQGDTIDSVIITRNGAAAQAFDVNAHGLPSVENASAAIARINGGFELNYQQTVSAEYFVFHTGDFQTWSMTGGEEFYFNAPTQTPLDVTSLTTGESKRFFSATKVQYPGTLLTPAVGIGMRLQIDINTQGDTFTFDLTGTSTGSYAYSVFPSSVFPINFYRWDREAYRGRLVGSISGLAYNNGTDPIDSLNVSFAFDTPTSGKAKGSLTSTQGRSLPAEGDFTLINLP